jgi:hypothetical protein
MLLVVVPMSLALLTPPRAAPLPQPAATPIALPVPASADPMQRERRDKMPMFDAAPSGRTFPSDDIRVIVRPSSEGLLTDPLLPGRLIICVRAVAGAQALPPAATVFDAPLQPVGSFALQPSDGSATIDCSQGGVWWPCPPEALDGLFDVQAVIPEGGTGCDLDAAGNWMSEPLRVRLHADQEDHIQLTVDQRIAPTALPPIRGVEWIERHSALRSAALGRDVVQRAAIVFPADYSNVYSKRRVWPTVYVIPPQGEFVQQVADVAQMLRVASRSEAWPNAVHIVLDPESSFGHHAFVDSMANGPCGTALVQEFIPLLEQRFRLISEPSARLLLGHGAGGWAALWLSVEFSEKFGGAFVSCPDAVDFSSIVGVNLYRDESLFMSPSGELRAALRVPFGPRHDLVPLRISEEVQVAATVSPLGRSGTAWDEWAARLSPTGAGSGLPRRLCNPQTGAIEPAVVESWSAFDLVRRVRRDRDSTARVLASEVRILVGDRDQRMREVGVLNLQGALLEHMQAALVEGEDFPLGPGWIEIIRDADEADVRMLAQLRFGWEMRDHLVQFGHQE